MTPANLRAGFAGLPIPVQRVAMALVVVALYYGLWRPARTAFISEWAYPSLVTVAEDSSVRVERHGRTVQAFGADEAGRLVYKAPAGDRAFLGVVIFALLFPMRPYWLGLFAYNILVGLVAFWSFRKGVAGDTWGFDLFRFAQVTLAETISLSLPPLVFFLDRGGYVHLSGAPTEPVVEMLEKAPR